MKKYLFSAFVLMASILFLQMPVKAVPTRNCDVTKARTGKTLVGVSGTYECVDAKTILTRVNKIRKEACQNGYPNPDNPSQKLKNSDYKPMQWSSSLELIAQLRAAEATVYEAHTRPNGTSCFTLSYNGEQSWAENIAWNWSGLMQGIEQWYGEKDDWVKQNSGAVTGHYTSLIAPSHTYIGIGSFVRSSGGWYGVAGEFGSECLNGTKQNNLSGKYIQIIEVKNTNLKNWTISGPNAIKKGRSGKYSVKASVCFKGIMGGTNKTSVLFPNSVTWKSSKSSVAKISKSGKVSAKRKGKTTISAKLPSGKKLRKKITIK